MWLPQKEMSLKITVWNGSYWWEFLKWAGKSHLLFRYVSPFYLHKMWRVKPYLLFFLICGDDTVNQHFSRVCTRTYTCTYTHFFWTLEMAYYINISNVYIIYTLYGVYPHIYIWDTGLPHFTVLSRYCLFFKQNEGLWQPCIKKHLFTLCLTFW